ncbi:MAG: hypothetical protein ACRDRL_33700 [Sciscionella sp.]
MADYGDIVRGTAEQLAIRKNRFERPRGFLVMDSNGARLVAPERLAPGQDVRDAPTIEELSAERRRARADRRKQARTEHQLREMRKK